MYKVVGLLKRPEGVQMEDFRRWWLEAHAPKVMKWKDATRYCVNLCTTDDQRYDGMAETWFETKQDMDNAFAPVEGQTERNRRLSGDCHFVHRRTGDDRRVSGSARHRLGAREETRV